MKLVGQMTNKLNHSYIERRQDPLRFHVKAETNCWTFSHLFNSAIEAQRRSQSKAEAITSVPKCAWLIHFRRSFFCATIAMIEMKRVKNREAAAGAHSNFNEIISMAITLIFDRILKDFHWSVNKYKINNQLSMYVYDDIFPDFHFWLVNILYHILLSYIVICG